MPKEKNKELDRRTIEAVWNEGKLDLLDKVFDKKMVGHGTVSAAELRAPDEVKKVIDMYRAAFPDLRVTIEDQIAERDKVVTRWSAIGTHKGRLMGIEPTGKQVTLSGVSINRIVRGKVVESWVHWDALGLFQQLGVAPLIDP